MLPYNLISPHFLVHPNLTSKVAFLCSFSSVTSSLSPLHLSFLFQDFNCWPHAGSVPSPSCSLAPFVSFQLFCLYHADLPSSAQLPTFKPQSLPQLLQGHYFLKQSLLITTVSPLSHASCVFDSPAWIDRCRRLQTNSQMWFRKWLTMRIVHGCTNRPSQLGSCVRSPLSPGVQVTQLTKPFMSCFTRR